MSYRFLKGHGTENDFVLLPDHDGSIHGELSAERVRALCDRRAGIGADGVLRVIRSAALGSGGVETGAGAPSSTTDSAAVALGSGGVETGAGAPSSTTGSAAVEEVALRPSRDPGAPEWFMDYRNADGSMAEMCGNGIRVFAHHLVEEGLVAPGRSIRIGTRAGVKVLTPHGEQWTADIGSAHLLGETKVAVGDRSWPAVRVDLGNPHAVVMFGDLSEAGNLAEEPGYDAATFPEGVNVEFVVRRGADHVAMRVHERGSGETRSCGTGACAAVVAAGNGTSGTWRVDVPGGRLEVGIDEAGRVSLTGPAVVVARGETDL